MNEMWEELKKRINAPLPAGIDDYGLTWVKHQMQEIERRTLPERVAEILEKVVFGKLPYATCDAQTIYEPRFDAIAKALRSGDTTEIEKWCK